MIHALSKKSSFTALASLVAVTVLSMGCGSASDDGSVHANVEVTGQSSQALTTGLLRAVNGTYTGCTSRSGSWSVLSAAGISASTTLDHPALSVVKGDTTCVLSVTDLVAAAGTYDAASDISMSNAYGTATGFATIVSTVRQPTAFFANAKLSATTFTADFTLDILFSGDVGAGTGSKGATFAAQSSTYAESEVVAPAYTVSMTDFSFQSNVGNTVDSTAGNFDLSLTGQAGEFYVMNSTLGATPTYAEVDAAWSSPVALTLEIDDSVLSLGGAALPATRNLIIAHIENGVRAYQVIRITFNVAS